MKNNRIARAARPLRPAATAFVSSGIVQVRVLSEFKKEKQPIAKYHQHVCFDSIVTSSILPLV